MSTRVMQVTASINGGPAALATLTIDRPVQYVRSEFAVKPDPTWTFLDARGHYHAYDDKSGLPTLRASSVPVPCDGSCAGACGGEGYTRTEYRCLVCEEVVKPQTVPDEEAMGRGTPIELPWGWSVKIRTRGLPSPAFVNERGPVSVVIDCEKGELLTMQYYGFAALVGYETAGYDDQFETELSLTGVTELGQRGTLR